MSDYSTIDFEMQELLSSLMESTKDKIVVHKGGKGSGFTDHPGRPGKVGGSSSDRTAKRTPEEEARHQEYLAKRRARRAARVGKLKPKTEEPKVKKPISEEQLRAEEKEPWRKDYKNLDENLGESLHVQGELTPFVREQLEKLNSVPGYMLQYAANFGVEVYIGDMPSTSLDTKQMYADVSARGWEGGYTIKDVAGFFDPVDRSVILGNGNCESTTFLATHEFGHAIGFLTGLSNTEEFRRIHKETYNVLEPYYQQGGRGGYTGCDELFADAFTHYVVDPIVMSGLTKSSGKKTFRKYRGKVSHVINEYIGKVFFEINEPIREDSGKIDPNYSRWKKSTEKMRNAG